MKKQDTRNNNQGKLNIQYFNFKNWHLVLGIYLFLASCILFLAAPAQATVLDPTRLGLGARSVGLGRCSVALYDDYNAVFINPANAAELKTWGVSSMYTNLSEDIAYTQLGGVLPQEFGTLGLSYLSGVSGGLIGTTMEAGRVVPSGFTFDYSSSVISLIYGKEVSKEFSLGATLKYFSKSFSSVSSGNGFDMDLGVLWKPTGNVKVGLSQQNTLPAPLAAMTWGTGNSEGIPFNTKLGVSYTPWPDLLILTDLDYSRNNPLLGHAGIEWGPLFKFLKLRGGIDQYAQNSSSSVTNFTLGVGLAFAGFGFDFAYYNDTLLPSNVAYYFSFRYQPPTTTEIAAVTKLIEVVLVKKYVLKTFPDVPEGFFARDEINYLATANFIAGYPDGTFKPTKSLTRAEMAKLLVGLSGKQVDLAAYGKVFKDVKKGAWSTPYILLAYKEGWLSGYPDKTFKPNKTLSRAEALALITKFDNLKIPLFVTRRSFPDLPENHWAAGYVFAAKEAGWLEYISGRDFAANRGFSRMEAAHLLAKTAAGRNIIADVKSGL